MECDGSASVEDSERCHEKCTCHQDKDGSSMELGKGSQHVHTRKRHKKFSHPHIGRKEMDNLKHLFTKWIKEYNGGERGTNENEEKASKSETLRDERVSFINKMLKNYQYFRRKENTLKLLQQQQDDLVNQQQHLENLLTKQEEVLTRTGSAHDNVETVNPEKSRLHHSHADDVNITITTTNTTQAPPTTTAPNVSSGLLNQQALNDIEAIKKQIAEIRGQQDFLSKQQSQLSIQLAKEQALFEQARQLIQLVIKQNQGAADAASSPAVPPTQSDYEGDLKPEEPQMKIEDSSLLDKLQSVLSKLVFSEGRNAQDGNSDDGQQTLFLHDNQEDQANQMLNENSEYAKNADIEQEPSTAYKVPVEIDRSDLNDQGPRNALIGRNGIDNSDRDDDNDNAFAMDRSENDDDNGPDYEVMEKKTLHSYDTAANSSFHKTDEMFKNDKHNDQANKTKNPH